MATEAEQIRVEILATAAQFRAELDTAIGKLAGPGGLTQAVKDVPKDIKVDVLLETAAASSKLGKLRDAMRDTKRVLEDPASADVDIAKAELKLEALKRKVAEVKRDIGEREAFGGGGGILSGISGGASGGAAAAPGLGAAAVAGAPIVAGGLGGLTALLGSAGAGILGAGALGVGGIGAATVGLGSMFAVIKSGAGDISKMTAALEKAEKDTAAYGASSKQVAQDQANINALVKVSSPLLLTIAKTLHNLGEEWQHVAAPATQALYGVMLPALKLVKELMPTIAGIAKTSFEAIGRALDPIFKGLASPEFKKALRELGDGFAALAPASIQGFANIFHALVNIAIAAQPYLLEIAKAFLRMTEGWVTGTGNGKKLGDTIGGLVHQFRSWWDLASSLGHLLVTIFSAGAGAGQGLVSMLTQVLAKWNAWLNTTAGQTALKTFFAESKALVVAFFSALGPLVGEISKLVISLVPAFTQALSILGGAIHVVVRVLGAIAGVMGEANLAGVALAGLLGVLAAAWAIAKIAAFIEAIKVVIAVVRALTIAIAENPFGAIAVAAATAAAALGLFGGAQSKTKVSADELTSALDRQAEALRALKGLDNEGKQSKLSLEEANTRVLRAEETLHTDRKSGHATRLQLREDEEAVRQARLDAAKATETYKASTEHATKTEHEATAASNSAKTVARERITTISEEITQRVGDDALKGKSVAKDRVVQGKLRELNKAEGELGQATKTANEVVATSTENAMKRAIAAIDGGVGTINQKLLAELKLLNGGKLVPLSQGGPPLAPGVENLLEGKTKKAGGGFIGAQGERGRDEVDITVGRGEAILHAGHQQIVNQALANSGVSGGLAEVFANTGGLHYMMAGGGFAGGTGAMGAMVAQANAIDARHFPYVWGGGHNAGFGGPFDCSGAVSAVLHAGGFLGSPETSGQFMSYGMPGAGAVTLYANPSHVYMALDGHFFGTSGANPGGGAGWFAGAPRPGFAVRHIDPSGKPGEVGGGLSIGPVRAQGVSGVTGAIAQGAIDQARIAGNALLRSLGGVPGSAVGKAGGGQGSAGGQFTRSMLEALWMQAGGAANKARLMAAVALAESGGDPGIVNSIGASGLWQIHPAQPGDLDPLTNARIAVSKLASQGLGAWEAYTNGSYRKFMARGGFAGFARGGFAGGGPVASAAKLPKKGQRPPSRKTSPPPHHAASKRFRWTRDPKFLPSDVLKANDTIESSQATAAVKDTEYQHLLDANALVPTQALVTLTDADIAFMDPGHKLGYEAGDEVVNQSGMTVGRFFGPSGIAGGQFIAGIDTRLAQISGLTGVLGEGDAALTTEQTEDNAMIKREEKAQRERHERALRMRKLLAVLLKRAARVKAHTEALTRGSLAANLKAALSRAAIATRKGELSSHMRTLRTELTVEQRHQSKLIPLEKEAGYTESLQSQIAGVGNALSVEGQLASSASSSKAIAAAKGALYRNSLGEQARDLAAEIRAVGGSEAGTGGVLGRLSREAEALRADQLGHKNDAKGLADTLYQHGRERTALSTEAIALGGTTAIQVRTPGGVGAETTAQLLALTKEQLATTVRALALSQAQFAVFAGFEPMLAGRLVGSFASGVDRVSRTGPAIVHEGEVILPDPDGPYGNRAVAQARGGAPIKIELHFAGDSGKLVKLVDARINERGLRFVSDRAGQRSRLIAGVTTR
jgi:hypothetical protein